MEQNIKRVETAIEKGKTYKELTSKFSKGIKNEFYLESLMIVYALLEDRLKSILIHIGAFSDNTVIKLNVKKTKSILRIAYFGSEDKAFHKQMKLTNITGKMQLIRNVVNYRDNSNLDPNDAYIQLLEKEFIKKINVDEFNNIFDQLSKWCEKRNEVVHALANKNLNDIEIYEKELDLEGEFLFRALDKYVKKIKRADNIRKVLKLKCKI